MGIGSAEEDDALLEESSVMAHTFKNFLQNTRSFINQLGMCRKIFEFPLELY